MQNVRHVHTHAFPVVIASAEQSFLLECLPVQPFCTQCTLSGCWGVHLVAAFMVARYKGVTKPYYRGRQDKWLAQSKPHGIWRYGFDTQEEGAEWLAKQLKLKDVGALARISTRGPSPELYISGYWGVICHLRPRGKAFFEARVGGTTVSSHATDIAAAKVVAKKRRVSVESLKKKQPLTQKMATTLFKASYAVFRSYVPGDLDNLLHLEKANAKMYSQEFVS